MIQYLLFMLMMVTVITIMTDKRIIRSRIISKDIDKNNERVEGRK